MESNEFDVRRTVLAVLEQCSNCKAHYSIDDARIIERQGELWVLSISCSNCRTQAVVAAVVDGDHLDVDAFERVSREHVEQPASVDDVLDMHQFLESFDGDFHALFGRRPRMH